MIIFLYFNFLLFTKSHFYIYIMLFAILENVESIVQNFKEDLSLTLDPEQIKKKIEHIETHAKVLLEIDVSL